MEQGKNPRHVEQFMTSLNWKINTGEIKNITEFQMDVFQFKMQTPLSGDTLTEFTAFIRDLPMTMVISTGLIWIWLYQHNIHFRLKFAWNPRLPVWYNLKSLFRPWALRREILSHGHDDIMACNLGDVLKELEELRQEQKTAAHMGREKEAI